MMKVTQEKLPESQIGLEIEIPPETSQQVYENIVKRLSRSINLPGFRKGKVPRHILLQRLGPRRIKAEALEKLVQDGLEQALENEKITAIGNYQLISKFEELIDVFEPGQSLVFQASVDVDPEIKLNDYKGLNITAEEVAYNPTEVDELLQKQQESRATLVPVEDRPAQMGDVAMTDYAGRFASEGEEGEVIDGTAATDFQMELSEGKFVAGLVEGVVGMQPGETKEIQVTFPEDYAREDLASAEVIFTVTLKEIKEKELPELDDDFAEEVSEFETMAELRAELEKQAQDKAERGTKENIKEALVEELLQVVSVELPATLIDREIETMLTQTAMQLQQYGMDVKNLFTQDRIAEMKERSRPEAIENIKKNLAIKEIAKREEIAPTETEITDKMQQISQELEGENIDPDRLRSFVIDDLTQEKTFDWLTEQSEVNLVPVGTLATEATAEPTPEVESTEETASEEQ
ncbi:MAG: trigger factor [Jaaginema sp. PMC 1079.18]|nr:trigger factor [Jaaginema sp. PMC 1080.18]MEC4850123.1 trigger factor [Jaaginema sp. PMC 1079.18]MEC4866330.1 trigger factor [Jaaginema sp. PMC 1078.18]